MRRGYEGLMTVHDRGAKERVGSNEAMFRRINESVGTDYSETDMPD
jgi:hypothetical protein